MLVSYSLQNAVANVRMGFRSTITTLYLVDVVLYLVLEAWPWFTLFSDSHFLSCFLASLIFYVQDKSRV